MPGSTGNKVLPILLGALIPGPSSKAHGAKSGARSERGQRLRGRALAVCLQQSRGGCQRLAGALGQELGPPVAGLTQSDSLGEGLDVIPMVLRRLLSKGEK